MNRALQSFLALVCAGILVAVTATGCFAERKLRDVVGTGGAGSGGAGGGCATECCDPEGCPLPEDECTLRTCNGGVCGTESAKDGTPTNEPAEACKKVVCNGHGGMRIDDDDDNPFDDGKNCTVDACVGGMPSTTPATMGTTCDDNGGTVCNDLAACVQCNEDGDCAPPTPLCINSVCAEATCADTEQNGMETDVDCGGSCAKCEDSKLCGVASDCKSGVCALAGMAKKTCQKPTCDDNVKNGLETDVDCGGGACDKCKADKGCSTNDDCVGSQCTGVNGMCTPNCLDGEKNKAETDVDCGGGTCGGCDAGKACGGQDVDCVATAYCADALCVTKKDQGTSCDGGNQCSAGVCEDDVCCNVTCGGTCQACSSAGLCSLIPTGMDPDNDCPGADVCDGNGACRKAIGETCVGDGDCAGAQCKDGVCCASACGSACQACSMAKTGQTNGTCAFVTAGTDTDMECMSNQACNGAGACKKITGAACSGGSGSASCLSGVCADGFCCNVSCGGTCRACDLAGNVGTCSFIPAGLDPDSECFVGTPNCNGAGACQ